MKVEEFAIVRKVGAQFLRVHQFVYEATGGRIGHRLLGIPSLLLHTVGAKTGRPRTNALTYARDGDSYVVVASMGGAPRSPGWYHNLRAQPDVEVQVGTHRFLARARCVLRGDDDFPRLWRLANENNGNRYDTYQRLTDRPIPVVVLTPLGPP